MKPNESLRNFSLLFFIESGSELLVSAFDWEWVKKQIEVAIGQEKRLEWEPNAPITYNNLGDFYEEGSFRIPEDALQRVLIYLKEIGWAKMDYFLEHPPVLDPFFDGEILDLVTITIGNRTVEYDIGVDEVRDLYNLSLKIEYFEKEVSLNGSLGVVFGKYLPFYAKK